jgi:hypothetical protein
LNNAKAANLLGNSACRRKDVQQAFRRDQRMSDPTAALLGLVTLQIPTQAGHLFQLDVGHRSDLKPATIPI